MGDGLSDWYLFLTSNVALGSEMVQSWTQSLFSIVVFISGWLKVNLRLCSHLHLRFIHLLLWVLIQISPYLSLRLS